MHCTPKKTIDLIIQSGNHYVAQVKRNQKGLFEEIQRIAAQDEPLSAFCTHEKSHGRQASWQVTVYGAQHSPKSREWKDLKHIITVERKRQEKTKKTWQTAYFITDLTHSNAAFYHHGIRGHWGIENRLHWVKDAIHKEDNNRIRKGNAPLCMSIFSTIAINIHRKQGNDSISYSQILFAANVKELFLLLRT